MKPFSDDTILARWLNGTLTPEELEELQKREDFEELQQLVVQIDTLSPPDFDQEATWNKLNKATAGSTKTKVVQMPSWVKYSMGAAATLLVFLGIYLALNTSNDTPFSVATTETGEQLTVYLPDSSIVTVNAASTISYNTINWKNERLVNLDGEAFFEVNKGSRFVVKTPLGEVKVLGTSFNVKDRGKQLEVACFNGKVGVKSVILDKPELLTAGQGVLISDKGQQIEQWTLTENEKPSWTTGFSTFKDNKLAAVFEELQRQYGVKLTLDKTVDTARVYSGGFPHKDLTNALKTICDPMQLKYELVGQNEVKISKE